MGWQISMRTHKSWPPPPLERSVGGSYFFVSLYWWLQFVCTGTNLIRRVLAFFSNTELALQGSQECREAQYRFTESMAGYSLVCYFLNIKDRHNGNLMLASDGRLLHIDFGFMLSNYPGGLGFETAPFKLTRELLEILDSDSGGRGSPMFDYFKVCPQCPTLPSNRPMGLTFTRVCGASVLT